MAVTTPRQFRLDDELMERLERYAEWLTEQTPGIEFNRTMALRSILTERLNEWEEEEE